MTNFADIRGTRTAYDRSGNGPLLLLIHGAEGSRRSFDKVRSELTDRFTVISYDQRDCGETTNPEEASSIEDLARDAHALIGMLGFSKALVFGTSFGGRVAQALAIHHPEAVEKLVLASTWPLPLSLRDLNGEVAREIAKLRADLPSSAEQLASYFFPDHFLQAHSEFKNHFGRSAPRSERSARRAKVAGEHPTLDLGMISAPTLLIAGELDRVVPPTLTIGMQRLIGNSECVVLPGIGHIACTQAPKDIAHHLRRFCH